jgi:hypothetical protein
MSNREMRRRGVLEGWRFSLGWWNGRTRFGIDVGNAEAEKRVGWNLTAVLKILTSSHDHFIEAIDIYRVIATDLNLATLSFWPTQRGPNGQQIYSRILSSLLAGLILLLSLLLAAIHVTSC